MELHDKLNSNINLTPLTLKEVDLVDDITLKVSYMLNTVKMTNNLKYNISSEARKDYNDIVKMLGGQATFLVE